CRLQRRPASQRKRDASRFTPDTRNGTPYASREPTAIFWVLGCRSSTKTRSETAQSGDISPDFPSGGIPSNVISRRTRKLEADELTGLRLMVIRGTCR